MKIINAEVAAGDGSDEYEYCVVAKYQFIREEAYSQLHGDGPLYAPVARTWESGQPASTPIFVALGSFNPPTRKTLFTIDGDDADMFAITEAEPYRVVDGLSVFNFEVRADRPIPKGTYNFQVHYTHYSALPCTEHPLLSYEVEYVAQNDNAVHEAYFDPVEYTEHGNVTIGASETEGSIDPRRFTYGDGQTAEIKGVRWLVGKVYLEVSPIEAVRGLRVGFVRADGSVHKLPNNPNTLVNQDILSFPAPTQPYAAGDKIILGFYKK